MLLSINNKYIAYNSPYLKSITKCLLHAKLEFFYETDPAKLVQVIDILIQNAHMYPTCLKSFDHLLKENNNNLIIRRYQNACLLEILTQWSIHGIDKPINFEAEMTNLYEQMIKHSLKKKYPYEIRPITYINRLLKKKITYFAKNYT